MTTFWKPNTSGPGGAERGDQSAPLLDKKLSHLPLGAQREALPIYRQRKSLLYALEKYRCVVIVGETGCGKTTQVGARLPIVPGLFVSYHQEFLESDPYVRLQGQQRTAKSQGGSRIDRLVHTLSHTLQFFGGGVGGPLWYTW